MAAALASSQHEHHQLQHQHQQQQYQDSNETASGSGSKRTSRGSIATSGKGSSRRSRIFSSSSHAARRNSQDVGMLHTPVSSASTESGPILHITGTGTFITPGPETEVGSGSGPGSSNVRRQSATFERQSVIMQPQKRKRFSLGTMSSNSPVLSLLRMEGLSPDVGSRTSSSQHQQQQRISVSVNITPVEMLPPSPPLTRVGTNESLEERMREMNAELSGGRRTGGGGQRGIESEGDEEDEVEMGRGRGVLEDLEREGRREDDCSSDASWPNRLSGLSGGGDINSNISQTHATSPQGDESFVAEMDIADTAETIEESTMSHGVTTTTMTSTGGADSGIGSTSIHGRANSPSPARPISPSVLRNSVIARVTDSLPTPTIAVAAGIAAGIVGVGIKPTVPAASASATTGLGFIGARVTGATPDATIAKDRPIASGGPLGTTNTVSPTSATAQAQASSTSPLTPTRDHPLYRAPSPQPWDLSEPPATNNIRALGVGKEFGLDGDASGSGEKGKGKQKQWDRGDGGGMDGSIDSAEGSKESHVARLRRPRIPHSAYYFGPPPSTSAYGTDPIGQLGVHHPREIVRIERDYSQGEIPQFSPAYPLELEGRITPSQFTDTINAINDKLVSAYNLRWSFFDNTLAIITLYISRLFYTSHHDKEVRRLREYVANANKKVFNPVGLNILWPKNVAFMFLEIEYY